MCFTLSAALGDHGPITHMGTGSPGSAPDGEAGSEAPTRGDCVVRDPHPDTRLGGGPSVSSWGRGQLPWEAWPAWPPYSDSPAARGQGWRKHRLEMSSEVQ